jgi:energy-coupling factor transporter ATP-binding protein EcfA2
VQAPRAFVFQNPDHQVVMPTVGADVAFGLGNRRDLSDDDVAAAVRDALAAVNLGGDAVAERQVATLSGGQKQRVAIAGALVEKPQVLLLDELTTFLDEADQAGVVRAVRRAVDETGAAAVWVTHRLEELEHCDMAAYMEDGAITQVGSGDFIRGYIRQQQRAAASAVRTVRSVRV